ncbi:hypothetical protein AAFN86_29540 [Roseomonas sp. CAU 1739]|uniref:hypothetical protein n=1 Tax=Roseomonas sp. CAU 1739 TaxID=3140364 RepID=UPI00325A8911
MAETTAEGPVTLLQALKAWCDPNVLMRARETQQPFSAIALEAAGRPDLGRARQVDSTFGGYRPDALQDAVQRNERAWRALLSDWRQRVEAEEIVLTGIQTMPVTQRCRSMVFGPWATEYRYDFLSDTLEGIGHAYIALRAWRGGPPLDLPPSPPNNENLTEPGGVSPSSPSNRILGVDDVGLLDPDTVAALLERHAEHVCTDLRVNLNTPGKASVLALAATKMKARAGRQELRPTLTEEADWLERWCAKAAPSYQPLGAKTISNKLGVLYRDLRGIARAG